MELQQLDIDRNATARKVRYFFNNTFLDYLAKSGLSATDLKSSTLDPTGVSGHFGNSAEYKMMQVFDYQTKCVAVTKAINGCYENPNFNIRNRTILQARYLDGLPDWQVQQKIGVTESPYRRKKQDALCEFADRVEVEAIKYGTYVPDLHIYKEN